MSDSDFDTEGMVDTESRVEIKRPRKFKVLLHNDDYTSMEFVIDILSTVFRKTSAESVEIMLNVHQNGTGIAGVYPASIAETKIDVVHESAETNGFPLRCSMEPE